MKGDLNKWEGVPYPEVVNLKITKMSGLSQINLNTQ